MLCRDGPPALSAAGARALDGGVTASATDGSLAISTVPEDLNADGTVDAADLAIFTADWRALKAGSALQAART